MSEQEANERWRGGILADDMGMGKTLQAISMLLKQREQVPPDPFAKTTLVVCPLVALDQWRTEIEKYTQPGTLSVLIYHGSNRPTEGAQLATYDVVLTSYSVVESGYFGHQLS